MAQRLLLDTDVVIDYSKGQPQAVAFFGTMTDRAVISAVTVAEMFAGVRDGKERDELNRFVAESLVIAVDARIAETGGLFLREYVKTHGVGFADAMIAATALIERTRLVTLNEKHFPMLPDLLVPYKK